eukprot:294337_1
MDAFQVNDTQLEAIICIIGSGIVLALTTFICFVFSRKYTEFVKDDKYMTLIFIVMNISLFVLYTNNIIYFIKCYQLNTIFSSYTSTFEKIIIAVDYTVGIIYTNSIQCLLSRKLVTTFNGTFLSINKINIICLTISAVISIAVDEFIDLFSDIGLIPVIRDITAIKITNLVIYYLFYAFITICFNYKMKQFIKLSLSNNKMLSIPINKIIIHQITKQCNLITIIALCDATSTILNIIVMAAGFTSTTHIIYHIIFFLRDIVIIFCVFFGFTSSNGYYLKICKYSHQIFMECNGTLKFLSHSTYYMDTYDDKGDWLLSNTVNTEMTEICNNCNINSCNHMFSILELQAMHTLTNFDLTCISNSFYHLLSFHDNKKDFEIISSEFEMSNMECHTINCPSII